MNIELFDCEAAAFAPNLLSPTIRQAIGHTSHQMQGKEHDIKNSGEIARELVHCHGSNEDSDKEP